MAASYEPSLSTSILRASYVTPDAPSMADQLPIIQFGFEDLRAQMAQFTAKFDSFIERGQKMVLEERNQFHLNLAEVHEDQRMRRRDIEILQLKTHTHTQALDKEAAEADELRVAAAAAEQARQHQNQVRDELQARIEAVKQRLAQQAEAQTAWAQRSGAQAQQDLPELEFWQETLCLRLEGAGREDRLKIVFSHLVEQDWDLEAWFDLGTEGGVYEVFHCRPKLDRVAIEKDVHRVNEDRDFGAFLKGMRKLFVAALR